MPSFNQAEFLDEALCSVLNQDYQPIELVVIDGGSSDDSVAILGNYSDQISYWVSEPDTGQADALNKGLRRTTGDIIGWLNSDDSYRPGALAEVASVFSDGRIELAMCDRFCFIDATGKDQGQKQNYFTDHETLIRWWTTNGMTINQPSVFFRRSLIDNMDPVFDERLHYAMDYDLWLRLTRAHHLHVVSGCWANYRLHDSSKTVASASEFVEEWCSVSRRFWGNRGSPRWWKLWSDYFMHWWVMRPFGRLRTMLRGQPDVG